MMLTNDIQYLSNDILFYLCENLRYNRATNSKYICIIFPEAWFYQQYTRIYVIMNFIFPFKLNRKIN